MAQDGIVQAVLHRFGDTEADLGEKLRVNVLNNLIFGFEIIGKKTDGNLSRVGDFLDFGLFVAFVIK